ncbi:MAG: AEC family transporter [Lachnospiraceae bacterium]|jgi:predicted permease
MVIISAMLKIVVALALGYGLFKAGVLTKESNAVMSRLIILVTCPCLVFSSIAGMDGSHKADVWILLVVGVAVYVVLTIVAYIVVKLLRVGKESFNTFLCMITMGNVGFIGFPLAQSLYGELGVFYIGVLNVHFTLYAYTIGITLLTGEKGKGNFKLKNIVNTGTVGAVLALVLYLCDIRLPSIVLSPLSFIGQLTSPLAMIVLGATLASYSLKKMFGNWRYYVIAVVKLLLIPAAVFFTMRAIMGNNEMTALITLYVGCPTATMIPMATLAYGGDWENASSGTGLITLAGIICIPLQWLMITCL